MEVAKHKIKQTSKITAITTPGSLENFAPSLSLLPSDSGRILELLEGGLLPLQLQHLQPGLQLLLRLPLSY